GEFARGKEPAPSLLGRRPRGTEGIADVALGVGGSEFFLVVIDDTMHAQRTENSLLQEREERLAGNFFRHKSRDHKAGIAVLILGPGLEIERAAGPAVEDLLR